MTEMGEGVSVDIVNDPNVDDLDDNHWLEVEYHYKSGKPVYGFFAATDSDGHTWRGRLNDQGGMCLAGLPDGDVEVELLPEEAVGKDDVRKLRDEIQDVLKEIIDDQEDQAEKHRRELKEQGFIQTTYTHVREVGRCAWQGGVALIELAGTVLNKTAEFVHYTSVANQLSNLLNASFKSYQGGELTWNEWLGSLSRNLTREQQEDVAQLIGVDPESVSPEGMSAAMGAVAEAYDIAAFIVDDEKSHEMLTQFAKELAGAQSSIDWACFSGAGIFEIVLAALLAATTAGAGYAAHAASQIRHTAHLRTLGEKFRRLAALLRHKKHNKKLSAPVDERTSVTADQPNAIDIKAREPYTPHPDVAAPKAGDRIHKREHKDGHPEDPFTLGPDGKPLGAESGPMPNELLGMEKPPRGHDTLVDQGWPTLNYDGRETFRTFVDAKPVELPEGTKIYRVVDEKNNNAGGFWSYDMPPSKAEWRKGAAVKDSWNDNGYYVEHTVGESGLKVWEGKAAGQPYEEFNGNDFYLEGGETQIFVAPNTVDTSSPKLTEWPEP